MPAPNDPTKYLEWKHKISESKKGKKLTEAHRKKLSEAQKKVLHWWKPLLGKKRPPFSKEWKENISKNTKIALKKRGYVPTKAHREKLSTTNSVPRPWARGRKHTDETKQKMSLAAKGKPKPAITGKNHYLWVEDRTKLVKSDREHLDGQYREWVKEIKNRDNWKCQIADKNCSGRLEAHHILSWSQFPELRYKINNGITLCHFHHPHSRTDEKRMSPYFKKLVTNTV